jgi:hypothetical protein
MRWTWHTARMVEMKNKHKILVGKSEGKRPLGRSRRVWEYNTRVYPKVSGLAAWNDNCKWYSSLPLGPVVSLFCESV